MTGSQAPLEPATDDPRVFTHPKIEMIPLTRLTPYVNNARTHSRRQIQKIADSIGRFGFVNPVLIADEVVARARLLRVDGRDLHVEGAIVGEDGTVLTSATSRWRQLQEIPGA